MVLYNTLAPRKKCMKPHWEKLPVSCTDLEEKTKKLEKKKIIERLDIYITGTTTH